MPFTARPRPRSSAVTFPLALALVAGVLLAPVAAAAEAPTDSIRPYRSQVFADLEALEALFAELDYREADWASEPAVVPRVYLTEVPALWRESIAPRIPVAAKKAIFFRLLTPLVLRSNELVAGDRQRVLGLAHARDAGHGSDEQDARWLEALAARYRVDIADPARPTPAEFNALLRRVDIVPVSVALAQAAKESGWGTSRFADEGNALFGQWSWGDDAMVPEAQRADMGDYGLASFESPLRSVLAYMHNLNTHEAYRPLRERRMDQRAAGDTPSGLHLAGGLLEYSEQGEAYVESVRSIIRVNGLDAYDGVLLGVEDPLYLIPVAEVD